MELRSPPLRLLAPLGILVISACAPAEEGSSNSGEVQANEAAGDAATNEPPAEPMLMADTGWLSVGSDGSVQTTFLDTGGRYRDFRNGVAMDTGDWEQRPDGSVCFSPDAGQGGCWSADQPEKDGSIIVTSADGKRVEIKPITYTAPPAIKDTEEDTQVSS
ncbi:hypothetical protein [uncultured Erythrobacter sp.]|uniref:hypothetical protein n=1 Tax=uncultured Erythrobacter sp. TaxID=263913 RepID=UPI0026237C7E|nr:hypothetical protein [uncultured Erythrobacter sp.]